MTHLLLPITSVFLVTPISSSERDPGPDRGGAPPFVFLIFCLACAALSVLEALWPSMSDAVAAIQALVMPQL